jgi:hypothetical protein
LTDELAAKLDAIEAGGEGLAKLEAEVAECESLSQSSPV